MAVLSKEQVEAFWRDGYLMVDDAVTPTQLARLKAEIAAWVEDYNRERPHSSLGYATPAAFAAEKAAMESPRYRYASGSPVRSPAIGGAIHRRKA